MDLFPDLESQDQDPEEATRQSCTMDLFPELETTEVHQNEDPTESKNEGPRPMTNARPGRTTDASHEPPEMASPREDSQMELFPELPSRLRTLPTFKAKTAVGDHVPWSDHPTAVDFPSVVDSINAAYAEVVHWKNNLFSVPFGRMGKNLCG